MAVGDDMGNVYRGKQGVGFATTFPYTEMLKESLALAAPKKKSADDFLKQSQEKRPGDTWHYYNNELAKAVNGKIKQGAAIMTINGSDNLWNDTSDAAFQWREDMANLNTTKVNIDQYKEQYDKAIAAISVREESYDPAYVKAVKEFPQTYDFAALATGKVAFPPPKFTNPGDLYADFYTKDAADYQQSLKEGQAPERNAVKERTKVYFADPAKQVNAQAAQQAYGNLDADAQKKYQSMAEVEGFEQPWQAHAFANYMNRLTTKEVDLTGEAANYGIKAPMKAYATTVEEGGITVHKGSLTLSDKQYPKNQARSYFYDNAHLLDNPNAMRQLGVSMEIPREERRVAAEKAFAQRIQSAIQTKFETSRLEDEGAVGTKEEITANWDLWRQRIGSPDGIIASEAGGFLVGMKDPSGLGVVVKAKVDVAHDIPSAIAFRLPSRVHQKIILEYDNEDAARAARDTYYKEIMIGLEPRDKETPEEFKDRKQAYTGYLEELKTRGRANTRVEVPIIDQNEQILKRMHDDAVKRTRSLYVPQIQRQEDALNILKQGPTTYDPAALDEQR